MRDDEFRREWIRQYAAAKKRRRNQRGKRNTDPYRDAQRVVIKPPPREDEAQ